MKQKINVSINDTINVFMREFPAFTQCQNPQIHCQFFTDMYYFTRPEQDLYFAVKVGHPSENHAIHVVALKKNPEGLLKVIYPTEKEGTGHFQSKMIQRTEGWQKRFIQEIKYGLKENLKIWINAFKRKNYLWFHLPSYIRDLYRKSFYEKWDNPNNLVIQMCAFCHDIEKRFESDYLKCEYCLVHHSLCDHRGSKGLITSIPEGYIGNAPVELIQGFKNQMKKGLQGELDNEPE